MAVKAKHAKTSTIPDGPDTDLIRPSDWNADHAVNADGPGIVGRTASGAGPVSELSASDARTFLGLGTAALVNTGTSGATVPLLNAANTWSAAQTVPALFVNGAAGTNRPIEFFTSGAIRWRINASGDAESGSNAGSNMNFVRFDDSGNSLGAALEIVRQNGQLNVFGLLNALDGASITGSATATGTVSGNVLRSTNSVANEGGEIGLAKPASSTSITSDTVIDVFGNSLRVFNETGGSLRILSIDFTEAGIASKILHTGISAQVQAGTATGQLARWNQDTGRYEPFDLLGTTNNWAWQVFRGSGSGGNGDAVVIQNNSATSAGNPYMSIGKASNTVFQLASWNGSTNEGSLNFALNGGVTINFNTVWHAGNSAQVQAGTTTGQLARWNNTTARYEPVTLNTLTDAADDAAAATAGVSVGGLYRTGSILKVRIA